MCEYVVEEKGGPSAKGQIGEERLSEDEKVRGGGIKAVEGVKRFVLRVLKASAQRKARGNDVMTLPADLEYVSDIPAARVGSGFFLSALSLPLNH